MSSHLNLIAIVVAVLLVGGGGYALFSRAAPGEGAASVLDSSVSEQILQGERIEKELLEDMEQLSRVTFDDSVYERDDFRALVQFARELPTPETGRERPFAPLP
ncbi:hypothetical protein GVX82_01490 [Patescibacteria group bacterium]|jgi:hypothetical protein|nr:hypothetical protein [Patescibacteria group bacterium]